MNIYVGNLPYSIRDDELSDLFSDFGAVKSANVIMDRSYGKSKGFGFVELDDNEDGEKAIQSLNGKEVSGRELRVNEARPRGDRPNRPEARAPRRASSSPAPASRWTGSASGAASSRAPWGTGASSPGATRSRCRSATSSRRPGWSGTAATARTTSACGAR